MDRVGGRWETGPGVEDDTLPQSGSRSVSRLAITSILFGLFLVSLMAGLIQVGALAGIDLAVMQAKRALVSVELDRWSLASGILLSARSSVIFGLAASLILWRLGMGIWSLAPLAFLVPTALELGMKMVISQPLVPAEFHRPEYQTYSKNVIRYGAFPSGHALRAAFFGTFLAVLLWQWGNRGFRLMSAGVAILALLLALGRVYGGQHWLSDVVGGLVMGATSAVAAALPVARRLSERFQSRVNFALPTGISPDQPDVLR